jgi:hypothetical protein
MTWDPLLVEDDEAVARDWVPFQVAVHHVGPVLEVAVRGEVDAWTGGTLLQELAAACDPSVTEVHVDLTEAACVDRAAVETLARCRAFAAERGLFRLLIQHRDPDEHRTRPRAVSAAPA